MIKKFLYVYLITGVIFITGCSKSQDDTGDSLPTLKVRCVALSSKIRSMDPGDIGDVTSSIITSNMYETLYQYHYLKRPYELMPSLAQAMPEISDDGLVYTIKIRPDVFFVDDKCFPGGVGRKVTAEDFIYAWKRIANIKYLSKNWWIFDGRIVGLDDFREYTKSLETEAEVDYSRTVAGLTALDNLTLQIKLTKPWPQILFLLAHLPTAPMAKEAVDYYKDKIINVAIGTGPFMLDSWQRGSRIILSRNPKFRKEYYPVEGEPEDAEKGFLDNAGKQIPFLDRVEITIDRKSTRLNSSHTDISRMPSSA